MGAANNETQEDKIYSIKNHTAEFGLDSCSTTHVCNNLELFVPDKIRDVPNLGIDGIRGTLVVAKACRIPLQIMDDSGERDNILLENLACIPSFPKNLISISQWSRERRWLCLMLQRDAFDFPFGSRSEGNASEPSWKLQNSVDVSPSQRR